MNARKNSNRLPRGLEPPEFSGWRRHWLSDPIVSCYVIRRDMHNATQYYIASAACCLSLHGCVLYKLYTPNSGVMACFKYNRTGC